MGKGTHAVVHPCVYACVPVVQFPCTTTSHMCSLECMETGTGHSRIKINRTRDAKCSFLARLSETTAPHPRPHPLTLASVNAHLMHQSRPTHIRSCMCACVHECALACIRQRAYTCISVHLHASMYRCTHHQCAVACTDTRQHASMCTRTPCTSQPANSTFVNIGS